MESTASPKEIFGAESNVDVEPDGMGQEQTNEELLANFNPSAEDDELWGNMRLDFGAKAPDEDTIAGLDFLQNLPTISYDQDYDISQFLETTEMTKAGLEGIDLPCSDPTIYTTQHDPDTAQASEADGLKLPSIREVSVGDKASNPLALDHCNVSLSENYPYGHQNHISIQAPYNDGSSLLNAAVANYQTDTVAGSSVRQATLGTQAPSSVSASGLRTPYLNDILNNFDDAEQPLRVIDLFSYPFSLDLQTALTRELAPEVQAALEYADKKLEAEMLRRINEDTYSHDFHGIAGGLSEANPVQSPNHHQILQEADGALKLITNISNEPQAATFLGVPQQTPTSQRSRSGTTTPSQRRSKNARSQNIANTDPSQYYSRLARAPDSWSGRSPHSAKISRFVYTKYGELEPMRYLSVDDISTYLTCHPLHVTNGAVNTKQSRLTIWIQTVPADASKRYPHSGSSKCRFESCPDVHHTIRAGGYRLAFDELHLANGKTDPYHNAFYVHLYCMENNFNFPQLCQDFNVVPDCRTFAEPTNRMAINRDHSTMREICMDFINHATDKATSMDDLTHAWFKKSLTRRLTKEHIRKSSSHSIRKRQERGGINIEVHLGNLDMQAEMKRDRKTERSSATPPPEVTSSIVNGTSKKRRIVEVDEEDSELDDDILDKDYVPKQQHIPKQKKPKKNVDTAGLYSIP